MDVSEVDYLGLVESESAEGVIQKLEGGADSW